MKYYIILIAVISQLLIACNDNKSKELNTTEVTDTALVIESKKNFIDSKITNNKKKFVVGDKVEFEVNIPDTISIESYSVFLNDKKFDSQKSDIKKYVWESKNAKPGKNTITFKISEEKYKSENSVSVMLLPNKKPIEYKYKIVNVFPHDKLAYTQGLFYKDGFLYEATGLRGESTIRKVKLETGEIVQSFAIPKEIFGEGITYFNNMIVQLSWNSGRGFVYNFSDFKLIDEFNYAGEGWGIEYYNEKLYMSDGTNVLKILEGQSYSVIDKLEVFDNDGPVNYLNELEMIDGKLWANIYRHEKIAIINPESGNTEGYINLKRLLPMTDYDAQTDVLNGIAYDKENARIFVTGKKWPKLFEIKIIK